MFLCKSNCPIKSDLITRKNVYPLFSPSRLIRLTTRTDSLHPGTYRNFNSLSSASYYRALAADNIPSITGAICRESRFLSTPGRVDGNPTSPISDDRSAIIEFTGYVHPNRRNDLHNAGAPAKMLVHATRTECIYISQIARECHYFIIGLPYPPISLCVYSMYLRNRIRPLYIPPRRPLNRRSSAHENYTPPGLARAPPFLSRAITIGI